MSGPIDVVGMARGIADKFRRMSNDPQNVNAIDLDEAAEAVEELIWAAAAIVEHDTDSPAHNRVLAALAACRGDA